MQSRLMTTEDYEAVHHLWSNTPGMGLNNLDDSTDGIEKYLRRNPTPCFVAIDGHAVVGFILSGHDGRRGYIYHTAVAVDQRNQGIGTALLESALIALKVEKINKVALVVFERNETGNDFWEKRGFTKRTDLVYGNQTLREMVRIDI